MLNKEICKRCWEENSSTGWTDEHDKIWEKENGLVCPSCLTYEYMAYKKKTEKMFPPPEWCKYKLEHLV